MSGGNDRWNHFLYEAEETWEDVQEIFTEVFWMVWEIITETFSIIWEIIVELFTGLFTDFWEIAVALIIIIFLWYSLGGFNKASQTIGQEQQAPAAQNQQNAAQGDGAAPPAGQSGQPIIQNPTQSAPSVPVQAGEQNAAPAAQPVRTPVAPGSDIYITQ